MNSNEFKDQLEKMTPAKTQGLENTGESYSYSFGYSYFDPQKGYVMEYQGPFNGVGPNGFLRSDRRIRQDLLQRLALDKSFDAKNIVVDVKKGEVMLRGSVQDRQARCLAEELAFSVPGTTCVHNELRILPGAEPLANSAQE